MTKGNIKIWWEIWEKVEPRLFLFNCCYIPRPEFLATEGSIKMTGERSVVEERSDEEVFNLPDF